MHLSRDEVKRSRRLVKAIRARMPHDDAVQSHCRITLNSIIALATREDDTKLHAQVRDNLAGLVAAAECAGAAVNARGRPMSLDTLRTAYHHLLGLPHDETRMRLQPVLAGLRDEIARLTGRASEEVQDEHEYMATLTLEDVVEIIRDARRAPTTSPQEKTNG